MKQKQYAPMSIAQMALSIYAVERGLPRRRADEQDPGLRRPALHDHFANTQGELMTKIVETGAWDKDIEAVFKQGIVRVQDHRQLVSRRGGLQLETRSDGPSQ